MYIGFDSPHETKQKRPFPVSLHVYTYIHYYVIERDDPLSLCKHAYTVYLRKDLYILFSRNEVYTKLCTLYVYICVFNVNAYIRHCSKRTYINAVKRGRRWSYIPIIYIYINIYIVLVTLMCIGIYILCIYISVDRNSRVQWCTCLWGLCCRMSILLLYCI